MTYTVLYGNPFGTFGGENRSTNMITHIRRCISHPPGACFFFKLDCSTTKRVPIPNDTSSDSSRRDVSNAELLGTDAIPAVEISRYGKSPQGCVMYTVVYGVMTAPATRNKQPRLLRQETCSARSAMQREMYGKRATRSYYTIHTCTCVTLFLDV